MTLVKKYACKSVHYKMLIIIICSIVQYKTKFVYRNACLWSVISPVLEPTAFLEGSDLNEFIILGSVGKKAPTFKAIRA